METQVSGGVPVVHPGELGAAIMDLRRGYAISAVSPANFWRRNRTHQVSFSSS